MPYHTAAQQLKTNAAPVVAEHVLVPNPLPEECQSKLARPQDGNGKKLLSISCQRNLPMAAPLGGPDQQRQEQQDPVAMFECCPCIRPHFLMFCASSAESHSSLWARHITHICKLHKLIG
jgi:hypothetical protein